MKPIVEKVEVRDRSDYAEDIVLSWQYDGARYHIWENRPSVMYKNSLAGYREPGYFKTRELNPNIGKNQSMVTEARAIANKLNLYEKAAEEKRSRLATERDEHKAAIWLATKKDHAAAMYEALKNVVQYFSDYSVEIGPAEETLLNPIHELLNNIGDEPTYESSEVKEQ